MKSLSQNLKLVALVFAVSAASSNALASRICGILSISADGPRCIGVNCPVVLNLVNSSVNAQVLVEDATSDFRKLNSLVNKNICIADAQIEIENDVEVIKTTLGQMSILQ